MALNLCAENFRKLIRNSQLRRIVHVDCTMHLKSLAFRYIQQRSNCLNHCDKYEKNSDSEIVSVQYIQGLPNLTIPLPSRNEKCCFALRPISQNVGDLVKMLKREDHGIDSAVVLNKSGVRIASTCNIQSLMNEPFCLHINNRKFEVVPPRRECIDINISKELSNNRILVARLYEALHFNEYHLKKQQETMTKLEDLKSKIDPMEKRLVKLSNQAKRKATARIWTYLGLMSVQFGICARLTWWDYSWDVMEPITYFLALFNVLVMYAYFCTTGIEYNMPDVHNRQHLQSIYKIAKKANFDVDEYNSLKRKIMQIENELRRLKDPLNADITQHLAQITQIISSSRLSSSSSSLPSSSSSPSSSGTPPSQTT